LVVLLPKIILKFLKIPRIDGRRSQRELLLKRFVRLPVRGFGCRSNASPRSSPSWSNEPRTGLMRQTIRSQRIEEHCAAGPVAVEY
jgi:hypothetical protein